MAMVGAFELAFTKMHQKRCYKILCALYEYIGWLVFLQNVHVFGSRRVPECRSSKCSMSSHLSFHIWNKPYKSQQNRPEKKFSHFYVNFFVLSHFVRVDSLLSHTHNINCIQFMFFCCFCMIFFWKSRNGIKRQ